VIDWQPLETAPRDGTRILVAMSGDFLKYQPWDAPGDEYRYSVANTPTVRGP